MPVQLKSHNENDECQGGAPTRVTSRDKNDERIHGNRHLGGNKLNPSSK